jgi:hypothetical protein
LDKKCVDPRNSAVFFLRILGLFPFLSNKILGFHIHSGYWFLKMIPTYDREEAYLMTDQHLFLNASGLNEMQSKKNNFSKNFDYFFMAGDRNARNSITYVLKLWDFR